MRPIVGAGHARDSEDAVKNRNGENLESTNDQGHPGGQDDFFVKRDLNRGHGPLLRKNQTAILGFGNRLWRDDGAGSILAERLRQANPGAPIFDGGMAPENFLEKVAQSKPASILLIDAGDFGGAPGEWRTFSGDELAFTGISTHAGSPRMVAAYLEIRTGVGVSLLMIQPGDTGEGNELSPEVEATLTNLETEWRARQDSNLQPQA